MEHVKCHRDRHSTRSHTRSTYGCSSVCAIGASTRERNDAES